MRFKSFAWLILSTALAISPAEAATTGWLSKADVNAFGKTSVQQKLYPTAIECRSVDTKPRFRLTYRTFAGANKPFHKWQWVHGRAEELQALVGKIPLKDRPELKYRIVGKHTYRSPSGALMGCAIAFR